VTYNLINILREKNTLNDEVKFNKFICLFLLCDKNVLK
jgi:hypothetical protein